MAFLVAAKTAGFRLLAASCLLATSASYAADHLVAWGDARYGGDNAAVTGVEGVVKTFGNQYVFHALSADGTVKSWGLNDSGGDNSSVVAQLTNVK